MTYPIVEKHQVRLLLVEDDVVDRIACRRALQQHPGYDFDLQEADTGRQGLQMAQEEEYDCILLDYHLPDMTGLEFLSEIADETGKPQVPVLKLTGSDNVAIAVEAMKRGARDYLIKDNEGSYLELLPAVIERVLSEQRLLEERNKAEMQYRMLVERIPAITYVVSLEDKFTTNFVSPQISCLGFTPEEWTQQHDRWLQQIHPEDRDRTMQVLLQSRNTDEPFCCDYRIFSRTGELRWFHDEASVIRDAKGKRVLLQGIMLDITEKKLMEDELAKHRYQLEKQVEHRTVSLERRISTLETSNARLIDMLEEREQAVRQTRQLLLRDQQLYGLMTEAVVESDAAGNVISLNAAAQRLLGVDAELVLPQPIETLLKLADGLSIDELRHRCLNGKQEMMGTHTHLLIGETRQPVAVKCGTVLNAEREVAGLLLVLSVLAA